MPLIGTLSFRKISKFTYFFQIFETLLTKVLISLLVNVTLLIMMNLKGRQIINKKTVEDSKDSKNDENLQMLD